MLVLAVIVHMLKYAQMEMSPPCVHWATACVQATKHA